MTEKLRSGYTTGACAAAAAKAAALRLLEKRTVDAVTIPFPDGGRVAFPIRETRTEDPDTATAVVRKFSGDDPDVTDGALIVVTVKSQRDATIRFLAGEGVGTVTRPGLSMPPGEPAINPGPRRMITAALREVTEKGLIVTIAIPGGKALAETTFNPRLGVEGGLSVLGTSGRVVPFSHEALTQSLACALDVALASGFTTPVFTPGNIGLKAAARYLKVDPAAMVEVSNEWDFMLDLAVDHNIRSLLAFGHPGKLAKLAMGHWNTHSKKSPMAVDFVRDLALTVTKRELPSAITVEGVFQSLSETEKKQVADRLSEKIASAIEKRSNGLIRPAVALVSMHADWLGSYGDISPWQ